MPSVIFCVHAFRLRAPTIRGPPRVSGDFALQLGVGKAEQAAAMTGEKLAVGDELLDVRRKLEQAHELMTVERSLPVRDPDLLRRFSSVPGPCGRRPWRSRSG